MEKAALAPPGMENFKALLGKALSVSKDDLAKEEAKDRKRKARKKTK